MPGWQLALEVVMAAPVKTEKLTKVFGTTEALVDLDLEMAPGEVLGYLGPNGAGKTTTIRLLLGILRATRGSARIFGIDAQADPAKAHQRIAYVAGEASLWPGLTGEETLRLLGNIQGNVDAAYRDLLIERFNFDPSRKVRTYSRGNRQKLMLIAGLMSRADLLLLDEPTAGLDPLMSQAFRVCVDEARGRGQTVFLSSHALSEVEALCDRVAILRDGRLIELGNLHEMRHLSALTIDADLERIPDQLASLAGVRGLVAFDHHVHFHAEGPVEPVLRLLAEVGTEHLLVREPTLEELFLAHYGQTAEEGRNGQ